MTAAQDPASPAEEPLWLGYALPPFHPAYALGPRGTPDVPAADRAPVPGGPGHPPSPRPRRRRRLPDGAAVSGLLAALCVASLLAAIGLTALRARC
ncbi:hypothetical protein GCM10018980_64110 [Streptomyces capoamus]|uniref:Uncharacterized protein n=1 Tax=Streptomyces capoamus TaxID=68183 RepID=A0A919F261_9ACTN|nr:hypothetical protein [Streptomyces capoamus]GGW14605.1 hypothetical protein GCM10010501_23010 [Streptomyces libani subsp. rufus]GHG69731.1 hypothetical protein GCM10018980_64110 [Streptomyces capoamus]